MALTTVCFCNRCKWRSSENPINLAAAGSACPNCGGSVSALHFDPTYVGTDQIGRPYAEAAAADAHFKSNGITTTKPVGVALPTSPVLQTPTVVDVTNG